MTRFVVPCVFLSLWHKEREEISFGYFISVNRVANLHSMRFALQRAVDMVTHKVICLFDGQGLHPITERWLSQIRLCYVDSTAEITSDDKYNMTMLLF